MISRCKDCSSATFALRYRSYCGHGVIKLTRDLGEYAEALYSADDFDVASKLLEQEVQRMGFDAVLYTYIPNALAQTEHSAKPHYQVSSQFAPSYLAHYEDARFDRSDPLIKAVTDGIKQPINWTGDICESYMQSDNKSREVIEVAREYGIRNGVTIPLLSGQQGLAGASVINGDKGGFTILLDEKLPELQIVINMYHNLVMANSGYLNNFIKPAFACLNSLEIRYLAGLASGKSQAVMAAELCRSEKYLEQVMLRMRRKISGVDVLEKPVINRNQLLYYAGLANIIKHAEHI